MAAVDLESEKDKKKKKKDSPPTRVRLVSDMEFHSSRSRSMLQGMKVKMSGEALTLWSVVHRISYNSQG